MGYYIAKLKYQVPKEETDEMKKESKSFLVKALSITEVEAKMSEWVPSNYQDAEVKGVQESKIADLIIEEDTETFWEAKLGDENEKGKIVPFLVIIDGIDHINVIKRLEKKYSTSQFLAIKKLNVLVEEDLINDEIVYRATNAEVSLIENNLKINYSNDEEMDFDKEDKPF